MSPFHLPETDSFNPFTISHPSPLIHQVEEGCVADASSSTVTCDEVFSMLMHTYTI